MNPRTEYRLEPSTTLKPINLWYGFIQPHLVARHDRWWLTDARFKNTLCPFPRSHSLNIVLDNTDMTAAQCREKKRKRKKNKKFKIIWFLILFHCIFFRAVRLPVYNKNIHYIFKLLNSTQATNWIFRSAGRQIYFLTISTRTIPESPPGFDCYLLPVYMTLHSFRKRVDDKTSCLYFVDTLQLSKGGALSVGALCAHMA